MSRGTLFLYSSKTKSSRQMSSGWNATLMCSAGKNNGVFIMSNGILFHVTQDHPEGEEWSREWDAKFMVPDGEKGMITLSKSGHMRHAHPHDRHSEWWRHFGCEVTSMAPDGYGGVFMATPEGQLRRITTSNREGFLWSNNCNVRFMCDAAPRHPTLFHGTQSDCLDAIFKYGMKPSADGRLGKGTYVTLQLDLAKKVAELREKQRGTTGQLVLALQVHLSSTLDLGHAYDRAGAWQKGSYPAALSIHPPWAGHDAFQEICIKDGVQYDIVGVICIRGKIKFNGCTTQAQNLELRFPAGQKRLVTGG